MTSSQETAAITEAHIEFPNAQIMIQTLGPQDLLLRVFDGVYPDLDIAVRDQKLVLSGTADEIQQASTIIDELRNLASTGISVTPEVIEATIVTVRQERTAPQSLNGPAELILSWRGKKIRPKTANQKRYVEAIDNNTVVFGLGPAGTGKTYLAMAKAVQALHAREVNRIILTRPAVEAGESLGFLPGTLSEKIDPYLRPLYDALQDMVETESIPRLIEAGTIEVAPLAYMRGRTLNDAFIILDEAQNTSPEQMKMFLTRLGFGSHMVVTGDASQVDLPRGVDSGLAQAVDLLQGIDDIATINLTSHDVVRHDLVGRIVEAYDAHTEPSRPAKKPRARR